MKDHSKLKHCLKYALAASLLSCAAVFADASTDAAAAQYPSVPLLAQPPTPMVSSSTPSNNGYQTALPPTTQTVTATTTTTTSDPAAQTSAGTVSVPTSAPVSPQAMQQIELQAFRQALAEQSAQLKQTESAQAYSSVVSQAMPLTPNQILQLKYLYSQTQRASQANPGIPPVPTSTTQVINLAPGAVPPVVRLSQGFITSLVFVDATGAPWPVSAYDLGNPDAFNIQWDKRNNILMIQAKDAFTYGNLAVRLQDLPTPVMLTLIPGQKVVDYRVDMRIQQMGPQAKIASSGDGLPSHADPVLLGILDGVPPAGSKVLQVEGGQAQAWSAGSKLLLRTRMTVISPAWIATMSSADGTNAYLLQNTPTILVSDNGALAQLKIEGLDINGSNQ